jgi:hypothetical protein
MVMPYFVFFDENVTMASGTETSARNRASEKPLSELKSCLVGRQGLIQVDPRISPRDEYDITCANTIY